MEVQYSEDGKTLIKASGIVGSFVIPEGVTAIGYRAFELCEEITSIVIPDSITSIGKYAFKY